MSLIKSLLLGSEGCYDLLGAKVRFLKKSETPALFAEEHSIPKILKSQSGTFLLYASFGYLHLFVHEFCHYMTDKLLGKSPGDIEINVSDATAYTKKTSWNTLTLLAGPLGNILFSFGINLSALSCKKRISSPIAYFFVTGACLWILGEVWYTFFSGKGDFRSILIANGKRDLLIAQIILITTVILGTIASIRLAF